MSVFYKTLKTQKGFTLVELVVVLLISGMFMLTGAHFLNLYLKVVRREKTIDHLETVNDALFLYSSVMGYYPCPANPGLPPSDPNYGVEQCRDPTAGGFSKDNCTNVPLGISCTTNGSRDGDDNGNDDVVVMGAFPFRTVISVLQDDINIRDYHRLDGYDTLLSYAVTEHMTRTNPENSFTNPFNPATGAISVLDENLQSLMKPEKEAQYVVFSHGYNGMGGYTRGGNLINNCFVPAVGPGPSALPAPGVYNGNGKIETENCDFNDAIFIRGPLSLGSNNNYYDDVLYYRGREPSSIWKRSYNSPNGESYIYNTNLENVGVDTGTPDYKLDIVGDIGVEGNLISPEYCDPSLGSCLNPVFLGGTTVGGFCDDGAADDEVVYAIGQNKVECRKVEWTVPAVDKACAQITVLGIPRDSYLQGFSNLGSLYCCTDTGACEVQ